MTLTTLLALVFALIAAGSCGALQDSDASTPFLSCTEKKDPIAVRVKGCKSLPCKLPKGQPGSMEVDFEVDQDVEQLDAVVTAFALGITLDFPLKQKNACMSLTNAECPLDKYEVVTYQLQLDVEKGYPSISLAVEISLKDKSKRTMMCYKLNLQVVDPE